jgi:hypothetical protein
MQTVETRLLQKFNYHSEWRIRHWRKDESGVYQLIWEDIAIDRNTLMLTGQQAILSAFFATAYANYGAPPANHYLALDSRAAIADTDTLATLVELTKSGYARKALISSGTGVNGQDFYINKPAAYYRADSKIVEWTAGENWITAQLNINLCTDLTAVVDAASKHLIAALALSAPRTLLNGDKLDGSFYVGLSN